MMAEFVIGVLSIIGGSILAAASAFGKTFQRLVCAALVVVPISWLWEHVSLSFGAPLDVLPGTLRAAAMLAGVAALSVAASLGRWRFNQPQTVAPERSRTSEATTFVPKEAPVKRRVWFSALAERARVRKEARKRYASYTRIPARRRRR